MKFDKLKISTVLITIVLLSSCKNYDELVQNPNLPVKVPSSLLMTSVLNKMGDDLAWTGAQEFNQFFMSTYTYYGTNNYDQSPFTNNSDGFYYSTLENVVRMEIEAKNAGLPDVNAYTALGKFFRAYYFNLMSQKYGDLPVSEALQGATTPAPKYDSQKQLYIQVLQWLDQSNTEIAQLIASKDGSLAGDVYFGNNLASWQKVVNTFTLRVLISLSNKVSDTDLAIKQKFAAIVSNPGTYPIMASNSDNLQYVYNAAYSPYPKTPGNYKQTNTRENISATVLNLTTSLKDPRTFIYGTPAPVQIASTTDTTYYDKKNHVYLGQGKLISDFTAYVGANPGDDMGTLGDNSQAGKYSFENVLRYAKTFDGSSAEPAIIIGYPELCFNVAEGINLGWATGSASAWYVKGITASMNMFGISDGAVLTIGDNSQNVLGTVTVSVTDYLAQPAVQYQGDNAAGRTQILNQKYIAFWQNSNWEAFFNQRRTGVPTFLIGPGTGNNKKLPLRWQYPLGESSANATNYAAAIQSQFGGSDNINGKLWINQ